MTIKISIVDDHPLVIAGLCQVLSNDASMQICGTYQSGKALMADISKLLPDVLLLDIQLQQEMADDLLPNILATHPDVRILILTNFDNIFYIKNMLKKGAHGYILKTANEDVLIQAIRSVCSGEIYLQPVLKDKLIADKLQINKAFASPPVITRIEKEVLQLIAADLTSQQIANKLFLSKRTIDNYRLSLLMKLGVKNPAGLIKRAIQMGIID